MRTLQLPCYLLVVLIFFAGNVSSQSKVSNAKRTDLLKAEVINAVDKQSKQVQEMVDMVFSFAELGFQEFETSKYLTKVLEQNGFVIERGISGVPTAWLAKWGSGKPFIALGSDIDCIPKASQKPGVAYKSPIIDDAPGHGEGHNSGLPLVIAAAIEVKKIMQRENMPGTLMIWPGVAEELVGTKAWYIRDGYFKDADACIFTHVSSSLAASWGDNGNNGLVSVEFSFAGNAAHAAGAPWRGNSALDAVELMNTGWNYKREHLKPTARSHYVITDGGDQPNVVPSKASVWYYFRERTYDDIKAMYDDAITIAEGAAKMTGTTVTHKLLGTAWPGHFNKALSEAMYKNIKVVGLPKWDDKDQTFARAVQKLVNAPKKDQKGEPIDGLKTSLDTLEGPVKFSWGGGSDDIADISWNLPTIVLGYPANIPGLPGHHWSNAIAMATPVAHKGVLSGSKALSATLIDILMDPTIIKNAWDYFKSVQTKDTKYIPFIDKDTKPAIHLNEAIMNKYRPLLEPYYYNPAKYKTYLEQLNIVYPTLPENKNP